MRHPRRARRQSDLPDANPLRELVVLDRQQILIALLVHAGARIDFAEHWHTPESRENSDKQRKGPKVGLCHPRT